VGTALVVDDERGIVRVVSRMLGRIGFEVLPAVGGEAALALIEGHAGRIELLVSDLTMPEVDGVAVATALWRANPATAVVFMSGYTEDERAASVIASGRAGFLKKPFTAEELRDAVTTALDAQRGAVA
jgi:two-component system cell cycle sensor histidine kinase/response regulator CckA